MKQKKLILFLCITALAIAMGCVFVACSTAQAETAKPEDTASAQPKEDVAAVGARIDTGKTAEENYSRWLNSHYSEKVYTHEMWLSDLLKALDLSPADKSDSNAIFAAAHRHGVIGSADEQPYSPLTRRYIAQTLYNALGYAPKKGVAADLFKKDTAMSTLVYYGFFIPDENGMVYPDAAVSGEEYQQLLEEARRYKSLKGKTVLAFGDSIMYGRGNNDAGIADMLCEKYGMNAYDYSVSGATFGDCAHRVNIRSQIKTAANLSIEPDVILINGGTNDMEFTPCGKAAAGFKSSDFDKKTFAGGFEYSAYLLQENWPDIPVVYIRAHDMDTVDDKTEQRFGETALSLSEKWQQYCVDIYNDTEFCTETPMIRDTYTVYKEKLGHSDGIHPTALGYAKFYLPLITDELTAILA